MTLSQNVQFYKLRTGDESRSFKRRAAKEIECWIKVKNDHLAPWVSLRRPPELKPAVRGSSVLHLQSHPEQRSNPRASSGKLCTVACVSENPQGRRSGGGGNAITPLTKLIEIPSVQSPGSCRRRVFNLNVKQNPVPTVRGSVHWGETCHLLALPFPGNEFMCSVLKLIYTPPFSLFPQTAMKSVILTQNEHPHRHDDLWQIMQLVSSVWCEITGDVNKQSAK